MDRPRDLTFLGQLEAQIASLMAELRTLTSQRKAALAVLYELVAEFELTQEADTVWIETARILIEEDQ